MNAMNINAVHDPDDNRNAQDCLEAARLLSLKRMEYLACALHPYSGLTARAKALANANGLLKPLAAYARKAMEGGYREAVTLYADALYDWGHRDRAALECYTRLALEDDPHAMCRAGWMLVLGRGALPNEREGWRLVSRAAELGDAEARARVEGLEQSRAAEQKALAKKRSSRRGL